MKQKENKTKKKLKGEVLNVIDSKTIKVEVESKSAHPLYTRIMKSHKKYLVDNSSKEVKKGDYVEIEEVSPISKQKKFKLIAVLKK